MSGLCLDSAPSLGQVEAMTVNFSWGDSDSSSVKASAQFDEESRWFLMLLLEKEERSKSAGCFLCSGRTYDLKVKVKMYKMRASNDAAARKCRILVKEQAKDLVAKIRGMHIFVAGGGEGHAASDGSDERL
jgi:hypothetical protein